MGVCVCASGTGRDEGHGGRAWCVARVCAREAASLTHSACGHPFFMSVLRFVCYIYTPIQAYLVHHASKKVFVALLVLPLTITYLPFHVLGKRRMGS